MARPETTPKADDLQPYTVTRALCMAGERVEVDATVYLTRAQGTELASAGKVTPGAAPQADAAKPAKPAKAAAKQADAAKPAKPAKAAAKQAAEPATTTSDEAPT